MAPRYKLNSDDYLDPSFLGPGNVGRLIEGINTYGTTALDVGVGGTGNPGAFSDRKPLVYDKSSGAIVSATIEKAMFNNRFVSTDLLASDYAFYALDSGSGGDYVIGFNIAIASYKAGQRFLVRASHANPGAATLNVDGLGPRDLVNADGAVLKADQIVAGQIFEAVYNATDGRFHTWVPPVNNKTNFFVISDEVLVDHESDTGGWDPNNTLDIAGAATASGFPLEYQVVLLRVLSEVSESGDPPVKLTVRPDSNGPETLIGYAQQELGYDQSIVPYPVPDNGLLEYRIDGGAHVSVFVIGFIT